MVDLAEDGPSRRKLVEQTATLQSVLVALAAAASKQRQPLAHVQKTRERVSEHPAVAPLRDAEGMPLAQNLPAI